MKIKKIIVLPVIALLGIIIAFGFINSPTASVPTSDSLLHYNSLVTIQVERAGTDDWQTVSQHHNFFSSMGQNAVKDFLGGGGGSMATFRTIALGNDSYIAALVQNYTDSGLDPKAGTYWSYPGVNGNWSISYTFTSSVNNKDVNATGLFNATTGTYFAGNNFTKVTLQNGDSIAVTWNISVS